MLVLTRRTPSSPGEAAFAQVLAAYGAGRTNLAGIVVVGSGFRGVEQHNVISGLCFTVQGLAVVGLQEVVGQSGYLFAPAHGAWTVGGQMAKLARGGSNPCASTDAAVKSLVQALRRGGIDPGYVQSLIVVDGELSGVAQPETERGSGVVVTKLDADSLAEAIGRATAQTAGGLAHLWTTADVLAALRILGLDQAMPATEALTNEVFPYSPYVLRPTSLDDLSYPGDDDLGPLGSPAPRPLPPSLPADPSDTGTVPGMTLLSGRTDPHPPARAPAPSRTDRSEIFDGDIGADEVRSKGLMRWLAAAAVLGLIAVGIYFGAGWLLGGDDEAKSSDSPVATPVATDSTPSTSAVPVQEIGAYTFQPGPVQTVKDCASTSYGQAQKFFSTTNCLTLKRGLFLTDSGGKKIAVSLSEITMPDPASAAALRKLLDSNGTGNVNTLLAEGERPDGYPASSALQGGSYASSVEGATVKVVETAWVDGAESNEGDGASGAAQAALQAKMP